MSNLSTFRLSPSIFNASLFSRMSSVWFTDLPATATIARPEELARWFGRETTRERRIAFDSELRTAFSDALASIAPDRLQLPPFRSFAADRADANLLSAPFRRLNELRTPAGAPERVEAGLALVLLLDQVPRHIFRQDQRLVFTHYDRLSRALVYSMMQPASGPAADDSAAEAELADVRGLHMSPTFVRSPLRFMWFTLPLMHCEDLADQDTWLSVMNSYIENLERLGDTEAADFLKTQMPIGVQHREILERFGRYPHRNESLGREHSAEEKKYLDEGGETFSR